MSEILSRCPSCGYDVTTGHVCGTPASSPTVATPVVIFTAPCPACAAKDREHAEQLGMVRDDIVNRDAEIADLRTQLAAAEARAERLCVSDDGRTAAICETHFYEALTRGREQELTIRHLRAYLEKRGHILLPLEEMCHLETPSPQCCDITREDCPGCTCGLAKILGDEK